MKINILLLFILTSNIAFSKTPAKESEYEKFITNFQKVITLEVKEDKKKISSLVEKARLQIVASGEKFLVVRPGTNLSGNDFSNFLKKLKKEPGVKSVENDHVAKPQSDDQKCAEDGSLAGVKTILDLNNKIDSTNCHLFPHCEGANPAWAKLQIGADLADEIVSEELKKAGSSANKAAVVAVVDSGFDKVNQEGNIEALSFTMEKGHDSSGTATIDPDGHGTAVSGMISAKGVGITKNVHLKFFRVTEKHAGGSTSDAFLAAAIEKACESSDIVNVSWGSVHDEIGISKIVNLVKKPLWLKKAAEKGCLIVQAAGNGGIKTDFSQYEHIDSPLFSVGASGQFTDEANFSSKGKITGPGEGVYSLLSTQHQYSGTTSSNACRLNQGTMGPINGTSFASPAIAGVAGQVLTVLKARGLVPESPKEKIVLLKSILLASNQMSPYSAKTNGIVNALGATLIASALTKENMTSNIEKLAEIGKSHTMAGCQKHSKDCADALTCKEKINCTNDLRYKFLVCTPPQNKDAELLFSSLRSLKEKELSLTIISQAPKGTIDTSALQKIFEELWAKNLLKEDWRPDAIVDNIENSLKVIDSAVSAGLNNFVTYDKFRQIVQSYRFSTTITVETEIGKNIFNSAKDKAIFPLFINAFKSMTENDQITFLNKPGSLFDKKGESELNIIYLLKVNASAFPVKTQELINKKFNEYGEKWFAGKIIFQSQNTAYSEINPIIRKFLESNPNLHKKAIAELKRPLTPGNLHIFTYFMADENAHSTSEKNHIAKKALSTSSARSDYFYENLCNNSVKQLLLEAKTPDDLKEVKSFLIECPFAEIPSDKKFQNPLLLNDDVFREKFSKANLERTQILLSGRIDTFQMGQSIPFNNFEEMIKIDLARDSKNIEKYKTPVQKLLENPVMRLVQDKGGAESLGPAKRTAQIIVSHFLGSQEEYRQNGLGPEMINALKPLKDDVLKSPEKYSSTIKTEIFKLYDFDEN